jgi:lactoylglutathione lyase
MVPNKLGMVMVNVSDMKRSLAFYRDVLGLALRFESPYWSELETEGATLALHHAPPGPKPSTSPVAGTVSIGFNVPDLDATCKELEKRGAKFVMPPTDRPQEGIRLAVLADPDGCPLSLAQTMKR